MQQGDLTRLRIADILRQLTAREIAVLVMNIQRDPLAYPPAAERTQIIRELVRRELELRRQGRSEPPDEIMSSS